MNGSGYNYSKQKDFEVKDGNGKGILYDFDYRKIFEGEYLNGEKKKGKAFKYLNHFTYIYEGEYLNNIKNGKAKEYIDDELTFEGEYLNGYRWKGKGQAFYSTDYIMIGVVFYPALFVEFEGEYLNGKKHGKGKEYYDYQHVLEERYPEKKWYLFGLLLDCYDKDFIDKEVDEETKEIHGGYNKGKLKFEGEYLNGEKNGKGKEFDRKGNIIFEGEYLRGSRWNGKVKEFNYNGKLIYEGEYLNGKEICK